MKLLIAALALVAAGPALADPVCEMRGAEPLPVFETAKAAFLKGDFSAFLGSATVLMRGERAALEAPLAKLAELVPSGFESCQTILQRRDIGGLVQEVTTFDIPGKSFPISLYLQAAPVKGAMGITSLSYNSKLDTVLNELH